MSKNWLAIIFFFIVSKSYSQQQSYLVLIDADNDQVFRVRIGDTTYNSSELGHLSIPYLKDSTYNLAFGFPQKKIREQVFSVKINKKDQGFQLKNLGEKGWALYNWQTRELKMPLTDSAFDQGIAERGIKRDDAFSRLMAAVVNDTSVMYNAFIPRRIVNDSTKNEITNQNSKNDSSSLAAEKNKQDKAAPIVEIPASQVEDQKLKVGIKYPFIKKLSERSTPTAKRITYVDAVQQGIADTITLFIPLETQGTTLADSVKKITPAKNKKKNQKNASKADSTLLTRRSLNVDCKNLATDHDVDTLRASMLNANTIEAKIAESDKYFKTKCFSASQVKSLGELFASDKSKYKFFETAYPYISDKINVSQLATLLSDSIYINRFKKEMVVN
ncbi:MAG: DUF4476 domain-containing protein [Bacteroidetes bacterium]|nr:DUF4476 domain-containing protein [Bacteroidota bacterium]